MIESKAASPVSWTRSEADEDARRGERIGAQVRRVALQRRRFVRLRLAGEDGRDAEVGEHREAHHRDADAERCRPSAPTTSRWVASKTMIPAPTRISIPSIVAARLSTFSWP